MKHLPWARVVSTVMLVAVAAGCTRESKIRSHTAKAEAQFADGAYENALIEYRNVLALDPKNLQAVERLGHIWLARGAPLRALPYFAAAIEAQPNDLEAQRDILQLSVPLGKFAEARKRALAVLARSPDDKVALLALAAASRSAEDLAALEKALREANSTSAQYHLASAQLLLKRGNFGGARTQLQRAVSREPSWPEVHLAMAEFLLANNEPDAARESFVKAAELAPPRSDERMRYAEILAQTGSAAAATTYLLEITRQAPDYLPAWRGLASIAISQRKFDEAFTYLQNAFRWDAGNFECEVTRSVAFMAKGETKQAIETLEALGKRFPGTSADKYQLGLAYLQNQDAAKAVDALRRAVVQNPDNDDAVLLLAQLDLRAGRAELAGAAMVELLSVRPALQRAEMLLLEALKGTGRLDGAVAMLQQRIKATPERAELHRMLGLVYKYQRNYSAARASFERSLELTPGFAPVIAELVDLEILDRKFDAAASRLNNLALAKPGSPEVPTLAARIAAAQDQWPEVKASLVAALAIDPAYGPAYDVWRRVVISQPDRSVAARYISDFLAERPDDFRALMVAGESYMAIGGQKAAAETYERCLTLKPNATVPLNNLAYLYCEYLQQPDRALDLAKQARQLDNQSPAIAHTLGLVYLRRKDYAAALDLLQESAAKRPEDSEAQYHLGLCAEALGQSGPARLAFFRALNVGRDFAGKDDAKGRLAKLGGPPDDVVDLAKNR